MKRWIVIAIFIFLSFVWGTTWSAIKFSLQGFPPFLGAMLRFSIALVCLALYARFRGISLRISRRHFAPLFWSAILLYLFDYGLIYWGEQYLYSGVTAIFFATFPIFTGVVSNFIFRNEPFQWNKFFGLLLGFVGIFIIFNHQLLITEFNTMVILASLAIIFSALAAAVSLVMVKKYLGGVNTIAMTFHQMLWGVLTLGISGVLIGETSRIHLHLKPILAVGYLGVVGSAIAFVLYYTLLKKMSAITLSYIIYITPLVAIFTGWLVLDEQITWHTIVGTLIIFSGIALSEMNRGESASADVELEDALE
ncbi:MAG: DMT family transporter [Calditrichaeota bacterium]|nr:MAG: DMT family transporter [Calditrichota bacterium]